MIGGGELTRKAGGERQRRKTSTKEPQRNIERNKQSKTDKDTCKETSKDKESKRADRDIKINTESALATTRHSKNNRAASTKKYKLTGSKKEQKER